MVLEELNSESLLERFTEKDLISAFPVIAAPVVYCPPSLDGVAEKVAGCANAELDQRASMVQRLVHSSDDDLDDLDCPPWRPSATGARHPRRAATVPRTSAPGKAAPPPWRTSPARSMVGAAVIESSSLFVSLTSALYRGQGDTED